MLLIKGDSAFQREKLKRFATKSLFDAIFIDGEQGVGKPEKEAYENVLKMFQLEAYQACMIGNHYLCIIFAPISYGLKAVWVDRGQLGVAGYENIKANDVIKNIEELLNVFKII